VRFAELVKLGVHGIEHGHHLHGRDSTADGSEPHHVTEQNRHAVERLQHTSPRAFNGMTSSSGGKQERKRKKKEKKRHGHVYENDHRVEIVMNDENIVGKVISSSSSNNILDLI